LASTVAAAAGDAAADGASDAALDAGACEAAVLGAAGEAVVVAPPLLQAAATITAKLSPTPVRINRSLM
jgi:hypothetical protein